jgi:hypothetical protein
VSSAWLEIFTDEAAVMNRATLTAASPRSQPGSQDREGIGEHQTTSREHAPFLHASLQGADLAVEEGPRLLSSQSREEVLWPC